MNFLGGMRGKILKYFIDECVKINHKEGDKIDDQYGSGFEGVIDKIDVHPSPQEFRKRMSQTKEFSNWTYEDENETRPQDQYRLIWYDPVHSMEAGAKKAHKPK